MGVSDHIMIDSKISLATTGDCASTSTILIYIFLVNASNFAVLFLITLLTFTAYYNTAGYRPLLTIYIAIALVSIMQ